MLRRAAAALAAAFVFAAPVWADEPPVFAPGGWIADLRQIERVLAANAPNLEWSIDQRGLDLAQLSRDTETALESAKDEDEARRVLRDFLAALGDGHISILWPDEKTDNGASLGTASICKSLGYEDETRPEGLPFTRLGARAIDGEDSALFPISMIDLPGGKLGVLRIPSFYEWGYFDYCPVAAAEIGIPEDGECDETCGAAIGQRASELLTEAVARQIRRLKSEGADALAVDITQNGGGSLWLDPVARMLTASKLKAPKLAFTRTATWRETFTASLAAIDADLANPSTDAADKSELTRARALLTRALKEAEEPCDRSKIWQGEAPACSLTVPDMVYATGVLDYAAPGTFAALSSGAALFYSSLYTYEEGIWDGPLYVLMDEGSASAAEHFGTLLRDNGAATLIGEPTFGAGCGWMGQGDRPTTLTHTRAELHVPDCVWTDKAGNNEVAGLEPDILVPWRYYDNAFQKARRALAVLRTLDTSAWKRPRAAVPPTSEIGQPR